MGAEHDPETVWQAQDLYCVDRLSFDRVAERTGIAASTLKRWAEKFDWRGKREQIAQAEADIRFDKVVARSNMIKTLLGKSPRADHAFAVASLETLALKEAEAARQQEEREALRAARESAAPLDIRTTAEAVAALRRAVEQRLTLLLARPEAVDLASIQQVQRCLALIAEMEAAAPAPSDDVLTGMSADLAQRIAAAMSGEL